MATLAAYDIRQQLQEAGQGSVEVVCYSFGAPRTGNHAFAHDYNRKVPDTWSIINDQVGTAHGACLPDASWLRNVLIMALVSLCRCTQVIAFSNDETLGQCVMLLSL